MGGTAQYPSQELVPRKALLFHGDLPVRAPVEEEAEAVARVFALEGIVFGFWWIDVCIGFCGLWGCGWGAWSCESA